MNTLLPPEFDLLYDLKYMEDLMGHLSGKSRKFILAPDKALIENMEFFGINVPKEFYCVPPYLKDLV